MCRKQKSITCINDVVYEKALDHTRVSVKFRKSENYEVWHLYLEAYPVYEQGCKKPLRVREYINRSISTPLWDKNRKARTGADGAVSYKPKRDVNGIIQCKSNVDQQNCIYADKIKDLRQREYDNAFLFTDAEAAQAEQYERSQCNFIEYFKHECHRRHKTSSDSIIVNWERVIEYAICLHLSALQRSERLLKKQEKNPIKVVIYRCY